MLRDISVLVRPGTPEWPGDTPYQCGWASRLADGATVNVSAISMSPHVGTHADAPLHVRDGAPGSEAFDLTAFLGPAVVIGIEASVSPIGAAEILSRLPDGPVERLLIRTGRCVAEGRFPDRWPVFSVRAAQELIQRGLRLLGVDAPSVDEVASTTLDVHHVLFAGGAAIIENLDLRAVEDGEYELLALPLRLDGLDASPVRALLRPR